MEVFHVYNYDTDYYKGDYFVGNGGYSYRKSNYKT